MSETFDGTDSDESWVEDVTSPTKGDTANGDEVRDADKALARRTAYLKRQSVFQGTEHESHNARGIAFDLVQEAGVLSRVKRLTALEANSALALAGTFDAYHFDGTHITGTDKTWTVDAPSGVSTVEDTAGRRIRITRGPGAEETTKSVLVYSAADGGADVLIATLPASLTGGWIDLVAVGPSSGGDRRWALDAWGGYVWPGATGDGDLGAKSAFGW